MEIKMGPTFSLHIKFYSNDLSNRISGHFTKMSDYNQPFSAEKISHHNISLWSKTGQLSSIEEILKQYNCDRFKFQTLQRKCKCK